MDISPCQGSEPQGCSQEVSSLVSGIAGTHGTDDDQYSGKAGEPAMQLLIERFPESNTPDYG